MDLSRIDRPLNDSLVVKPLLAASIRVQVGVCLLRIRVRVRVRVRVGVRVRVRVRDNVRVSESSLLNKR